MPEFSQLTTRLASIIADKGVAQSGEPTISTENLLENVGVSTSSLTALTPTAVQELLIANGIDPSTLAVGQIDQLFKDLNSDAQYVGANCALWSGGSPDGHD